jgi:hypothetical protein
MQDETEKTVIPFAEPQATMPDDLQAAAQAEAMEQAPAPVISKPAPVVPKTALQENVPHQLSSKIDSILPNTEGRNPSSQSSETVNSLKTKVSGTIPQSDKAEGSETAEGRLERLMRELNEERKRETADASDRKFKADIFKVLGDNIGGIVGGAQAMNTKAAVNPIKTQGYDVGDLVGGVEKKFAGDREALMDQYKQLLNARDRSDQRKFQQDSLQLQREANKIKQQLANNKAPPASEFDKALAKKQAGQYSETQAGLLNVNKNMDAVDDALKGQLDYTKNSKLGGTGPIATGFGLKKLFDQDTENLESKFRNINLKNMVSTFSGMSKAVDTDAERKAWESTQASLSNDDATNVNVLLGSKSSLLKDQAVAKAQQEWVRDHGNLDGFEENNPVLQGKVTTVVSPTGEMRLIDRTQMEEAKKQGYQDLDSYAKTLLPTKKAKYAPNAKPTGAAPERTVATTPKTVTIQGPTGQTAVMTEENAKKYLSQPGYKIIK